MHESTNPLNPGKKKRRRRVYPMETEAAWYVLKEFVDPLECLDKRLGTISPLNTNEVLCHVYSRTKLYTPYHFSKKRLHDHLEQTDTYYYRSKRNSRHKIGYGRSARQALALPFSNYLGITERVRTYGRYYVLLVGLDVDGHNGERDILAVQD